MKFSIHGFYQPRAVELGLTNDDLLVLRWFVDFAGTNKMKTIIESDGIYYWINYATILEDLPVLNISKATLKRKHFDKLCETKVLKHKHIKQGGSFSYYTYGLNYDTLVYLQDNTPSTNLDYPSTKLDKGYDENVQPPSTNLDYPYDENVQTKINLLNNPSINNNNNINNNITTTNSSNNNETIFDFVEKNFGRTLSPVEYEIIETWEDNDLTRHAIKEAILNGKYNLKYINAILHSYSKNGIKTVQQAQEEEFNFKNRHKNVANHREKLKMLQCNNNVTKCNSIQDIEKDIDKDIKEKDKKEKFGEFNNVMLTKEEYKKLENANLILYIERLSSYIASTGKKYKSHYATILNWSRKENATKKDHIDKEREEWINAHR